MFLSRGDRDLGVASQTHLVSQALSRGEAKDSILLSSRDGYPLEPKSGLNGVKPPVEFGERTRDCSLGHAGKEGPHLAMMAASLGFSRLPRSAGFLTRYERELREPLVWRQGSQVPMRWLGGARHCSRVMVG